MPSKLKQSCIFLNTGYDAYISNGKTSFTVRFEVINLSRNPKITQLVDYTGKFYKPVFGLIWGTRVHDDCGDFGKKPGVGHGLGHGVGHAMAYRWLTSLKTKKINQMEIKNQNKRMKP